MWLNGLDQFLDHIAIKKHRNNIKYVFKGHKPWLANPNPKLPPLQIHPWLEEHEICLLEGDNFARYTDAGRLNEVQAPAHAYVEGGILRALQSVRFNEVQSPAHAYVERLTLRAVQSGRLSQVQSPAHAYVERVILRALHFPRAPIGPATSREIVIRF